MQIVIDIPDRIYYGARSGITVNGSDASQILIDAIKNSTPLPKGHGKLVDVKQVVMALVYRDFLKDNVTCGDLTKILNMATIIEADKVESEDENYDG